MIKRLNSTDQLLLVKMVGKYCVPSTTVPLVIPPRVLVSCQYNSTGGTYSVGDIFGVLNLDSLTIPVLIDASNKVFMFQWPSVTSPWWVNYVRRIPFISPGQYRVGLLTDYKPPKFCSEPITVN